MMHGLYFFYPADLLLIPAIVMVIWAQARVRAAYAKYGQVEVRSGITGAEIAQRIMLSEGVHDVGIEVVPGEMTDHYDPRDRTVHLSEGVYHGRSIAALGIAAHEVGHVIQHAHAYAPMHLRHVMYPVSSLGTTLGFPLVIGGILLSWFGLHVPWLIHLGIWLYATAVAFTVVTLPVEFNASRRAVRALAGGGYLTQDELEGVRKVLSAAALTYVAAAAAALLQLLRLLMYARGRN